MKISIIGAGVIGCATSLQLARRGHEVTVLDRHGDVGHGSTSASCGIIRRFYSQPGMIAMAHEGASIWADWGAFLGPISEDLAVFRRPGMLFIPPRLDASVQVIVTEMKRLGVRATVLTAEEVTGRFPFLDTASHFPTKSPEAEDFFEATGSQIEGAVFEEDAGYIVSPGLATQNLREAGERAGVTFLLKRRVRAIHRRSSGGFRLEAETADGASIDSVDGDVLVNAAGPHSAIINRMAGVELPLETKALRREVHTLTNPFFGDDGGVSLPILGDLDGGVYSRPEAGGREVVVGSTDPDCDTLDWVEDPDNYQEGLTEAYWQRQCLRLMKRVPELRLGRARGISALYDVTVQDWYPIADRTDLPGYYVCIGTSGSSFKTSPVLGILMAELIETCEGGTDTDETPLQLSLPRIGTTIDASFLSRRRHQIRTTSTVIG